MNFRSLTLENFGTYAGEQRLDLSTDSDRPVVLIGGSNGAGKTTILEALLLCLHGRRGLGGAMSTKAYESHALSRIHAPPAGNPTPTEAALTLVLEHTEAGTPSEYVVERRWRRTPAGAVRERLFLAKDGSPVEDLPESAWQDFLDGLIPPGIADLFLFDGERIQELAEDDAGEHLADAVRRLLGLDVVAQLRSDLGRYAAKTSAKTADSLGKAFAEREHALRTAETRLDALLRDRQKAAAKRDRMAARATRERERFAQHGGVLATERAELQERVLAARQKEEAAAEKVREMTAGLLPFAICSDIAEGLLGRLSAERLDEEDEVLRRRVSETRRKLSRRLSVRSGTGSPADVVERILLGTQVESERRERVHDLTPSERAVLAALVAETRSKIPANAKNVARRLSRAIEERARVSELLDKAPEPSSVAHLLTKLQRLERQVGSLDAELDRLDDELHRARYEVTVADRELRRSGEALGAAADIGHRSAMALRASAALEEFEVQLQERKLENVELETARYFNRLSRKGDLFSSVQIDPASFRIRLRRWDGTELPKQRLSAGEKQLLAISVLWALAKESGRPLPVVIDTPLARLDAEHRRQLLHEYFPTVSHQVIVLSTDTEVDAAAAQELEPVTVRSYHLDHDAATCRTTLSSGYFFAGTEVIDAR